MWSSDATSENHPIYLGFSNDGWVTLFGHSDDALPQDFEMLAQVQYHLESQVAPKRIEFTASRGNDEFPPGLSSLKITAFDDNAFSTVDDSGVERHWSRVETRRYFLTLGATPEPAQNLSNLAMLTVIDGRNTEYEALGVFLKPEVEGKRIAVFDRIQSDYSDEFKQEGARGSKLMLRVELTEAEFDRAQQVFDKWSGLIDNHSLPGSDAQTHSLKFIRAAIESVDQCRPKVKLPPNNAGMNALSKDPADLPRTFIKTLRKENEETHVSDDIFPWVWRPVVTLPSS